MKLNKKGAYVVDQKRVLLQKKLNDGLNSLQEQIDDMKVAMPAVTQPQQPPQEDTASRPSPPPASPPAPAKTPQGHLAGLLAAKRAQAREACEVLRRLVPQA